MDSSQKFYMDEEKISYQSKDYSSESVISVDTKKVINLYLQLSVEEKVTFNRHLREGGGYLL